MRVSKRRHDYEAASVEIEADSISKPVKFRRTSDHNALQVDALEDARATLHCCRRIMWDLVDGRRRDAA